MKMRLTKHIINCTLILTLFAASSCVSTQKVKYFPQVQDGPIPSNTPSPESVIQKSDILSISVTSSNLEASAPFNQAAGDGGVPAGYLVNNEGNIQFPSLGEIKAEGMTKTQLKDKITKGLLDGKLLVDPTVTIRFINFRVTVLGEVNHPTVVNVPNEKISLLEALGLAGDLTIYGRRENVMVIRETKGEKVIKRLNLNSDELFTSPYYYLQSNDIVYVEPNNAKVQSVSRGMQLLPVIMSGLSLAVIAVTQLHNNK